MANDYTQFINKIYQKLDINLTLYKESQMKRRLTSLKKHRGFACYTTYYNALEKDQVLMAEFIDRITINVTEFFRNPKRWLILQEKILPLLIENKNSFKIWSAACSTGEEPYSIALLMKEYFPQVNVQIIATDIDQKALHRAKDAKYQNKSLKELSNHLKLKYFEKINGLYHLDPSLKQTITFKQHDLLSDPYPKNIDLLICRNVLIYFTNVAKKMIYNRFSKSLAKNSVLFVGSTEHIFNPKQYQLSIMDTFFYQKLK